MGDKDKETEEVQTLTQKLVEQLSESYNTKIEDFDKWLELALNQDCIEEYVQAYLQLRDTGFDFDAAYDTAAAEIEIEVEEEDNEETKDD
jgi:hypothetical protein